MSTATKKTVRHSLVAASPGADALERWKFGSTPDASLVEGEETFDATNKQRKIKINGVVETYAMRSELTDYWRNRGTWDPASGIPTAAGSTVLANEPIKANDTWRVTAAGTIAGLVGSADLEPGDTLVALIDNPTTAAHFMALEINQVKAPAPFENVALASLPADTPTAVNFTTVTSIRVVDVWDATGTLLTDSLLVRRTSPTQITLTSSVALANLTVSVGGDV